MENMNDPPYRGVRMFDDSLYQQADIAGEALAEQGFGFNKMFPDLPPFDAGQEPNDLVRRLRILGRKGGRMDAGDPLITITNPLDANQTTNPDNPNPDMTVGFTFLGQFLDHDITRDRQPLTSDVPFPNERTPFFDLDSVYGRGPAGDPHLYDAAAPAKLRLDLAAPRDLPRDGNQVAQIADPRNDENVIISQLQLAFLKFHNLVVDRVVKEMPAGVGHDVVFEEARRLVRWHYQYIIVNQFLPATLDPTIYDRIKRRGPAVFVPSPTPQMPREFQVAAYRFGHSQIRPGYKINVGFGAPIFDGALDTRDDNVPVTPHDNDPNDLRGGRRAPRRFVEWDTFFDFGTQEVAVGKNGKPVVQPKVKKNKRIDQFISSPMFDLPVGPGLPGPEDNIRTLAGRNLERHLQHHLASGQAIARELGYAPLTAAQTAELRDLNFHANTPLWWYILKEARVQKQGRRLGKVGSRIIAEVFFGLLLSDENSYWRVDKTWKPTLPQRDGEIGTDFTMTDLLTFARVA